MQTSRDHLLIRFMYYICTGNTVSRDEAWTPLERALAALSSLKPLCTDNVAPLASTVASLIKQQVCLAHSQFLVSLVIIVHSP